MPSEAHQNSSLSATIREVVFGMEDGMVSTLGAVTGIATGTSDHFTVVLAGFVIISVESIAMGVGSYLSNKSEMEIDARKMREETQEIHDDPQMEVEELAAMYRVDGWPDDLAKKMSEAASRNKKLFLQEMAFRELKIIPDDLGNPLRNGLFMLVSYIFGGAIPLLAYLLINDLSAAVPISIGLTLTGLFLLGVITTRFTKRKWWKAGLEMLALASAAALVGYLIGKGAELWLHGT